MLHFSEHLLALQLIVSSPGFRCTYCVCQWSCQLRV